jgi:hypothetical protein
VAVREGELRALQARYREKVARCQADGDQVAAGDWSGLRAILQMVFNAFDD